MNYVVVSTSTKKIEETAHRCDKWGVPFYHGGISPHDRSRGLMTAMALEISADERNPPTHLVFIDDDVEATREMVERLVQSAIEFDAELMTGVYVCRHEASRGKIAMNFSWKGFGQLALGDDGSVVPIWGCGFGLVVVHRRAFEVPFVEFCVPDVEYRETLDGRPYEGRAWFLPCVRGRQHLGEDRSFCARLSEQGGSLYCDTRVLAKHGGYGVLETITAAQEAHNAIAQNEEIVRRLHGEE